MFNIRVRLKEDPYSILVGAGIVGGLTAQLKKIVSGRDAVVITNHLVWRLHGRRLAEALRRGGFTVKVFQVEDSERAKSAEVAFGLVRKIAQYAADKKPVVLSFGGGVVGDLGGFVAALYKRGVPLVQIPTTLLAQIDSSIGGKVAVDLPEGKNLIGAFYQPRLVLADVDFLATLSDRQVANGLAEAVKYGVIADARLFAFIEKNYRRLLARDSAALTQLVKGCAAIKADVVSRDEKETRGLRTILNFGHTAGHAIETAAGYDRYHHGEAVALGMRVACAISCRLKLMKPFEAARVECLLSAVGLPQVVEGLPLTRILKAMQFDKKFQGKQNRFVMARAIGQVVVREAIPEAVLKASIRDYIS
ncbi:MAG: 3-dehydroquinate synthase [Candidatus Omnitrophica bacterium]|nr:3-dehydroquinate synthase [Candidatus Omnitrophota bacterium]